LFNLTFVEREKAAAAAEAAAAAPSVASSASRSDNMFDFSAADTAMLAAIGAHAGDAGTIDSSKTLPSILRKRNRENDDTMRQVTIGPTTAVTYRPGLPYRFNELNHAG